MVRVPYITFWLIRGLYASCATHRTGAMPPTVPSHRSRQNPRNPPSRTPEEASRQVEETRERMRKVVKDIDQEVADSEQRQSNQKGESPKGRGRVPGPSSLALAWASPRAGWPFKGLAHWRETLPPPAHFPEMEVALAVPAIVSNRGGVGWCRSRPRNLSSSLSC